jgi:FAD/FMN-containing dehydrogenase
VTDLTTTTSSLAERLAAFVGDRVRTAAEPDFDSRLTLYGGAPRIPAIIAKPRDAQEIARILPVVADAGLKVAVRGGGHSFGRRSRVDGGVVLDLSLLDDVDVDPIARIATAGGGVTAGRYTAATADHGLATGLGDTATVGVAGLTLGGGIGYLSRRFGLSVDQLLGAQLVTPDGRIVEVDASRETDLFWAIRGGGAGLGVVTALRFRLHEVGMVTGGVMLFEPDAVLLAELVTRLAAAPDELSAMVNVMLAPPAPFVPERLHGRPVVALLAAHSGAPADAIQTFDAIRGLAPVVADTVGVVPYASLLADHEQQRGLIPVTRSAFADSFTVDHATRAISALEGLQTPAGVINVRPMGGAIGRVAPGETAFAHRDRWAMVIVSAGYRDQDSADAHEADISALTADLSHGDAGYVNFFSGSPDLEARAYPPTTLDRLRAIRGSVDPAGLFASNG